MGFFDRFFRRTPKKSEGAESKSLTECKTQESVTSEENSEAEFSTNDSCENQATQRSGAGGRFEIKKSRDGRYVFNLYASNHVIVATSQVYTSASSAMGGIKSVIANAERAPIEDSTLVRYESLPYPKWEIYLDKGGQYRFRLSASNGSCVCHSQGYTAKSNCKKGIESIIRFARDAKIDKAYLTVKDND